MMVSFRVCGPKLSVFGAVLSGWGIIQLALMGICFYKNSVAFIEDIPLPNDTYSSSNKLREDITSGYGIVTENCFVAMALYIVTLLFSLHQLWMNGFFARNRGSYTRQFNNDHFDLDEMTHDT